MEAIDVAMCTLSGRSFQILGALKAKLWPKEKCLTDVKPVRSDKAVSSGIDDRRVTTPVL